MQATAGSAPALYILVSFVILSVEQLGGCLFITFNFFFPHSFLGGFFGGEEGEEPGRSTVMCRIRLWEDSYLLISKLQNGTIEMTGALLG